MADSTSAIRAVGDCLTTLEAAARDAAHLVRQRQHISKTQVEIVIQVLELMAQAISGAGATVRQAQSHVKEREELASELAENAKRYVCRLQGEAARTLGLTHSFTVACNRCQALLTELLRSFRE